MKRRQPKFICTSKTNEPSAAPKTRVTSFTEWSRCQSVEEAQQRASTMDQNSLYNEISKALCPAKPIELDQTVLIAVIMLSECHGGGAERLCAAFHKAYTQRPSLQNEDIAWKVLRRLVTAAIRRGPQMRTTDLVQKMDEVILRFSVEEVSTDALFTEFCVHTTTVQDPKMFNHDLYSKNGRNRKVFLDHYSVLFKYSQACDELLREPQGGALFDRLDMYLHNGGDLTLKGVLGEIPEETMQKVFEEVLFYEDIKPAKQQMIVTWFTNAILRFELQLNEPSKYFTSRKFAAVDARSIVGEYRGDTIAEWKQHTSPSTEKGAEENIKVNPIYEKLLRLSKTNPLCRQVLLLAGLHTLIMEHIKFDEHLIHCPYQIVSEGNAVHHAAGIRKCLVDRAKYGVGIAHLKNKYVLYYVDSGKELTFGYRTESLHRALLLLFPCMLLSLKMKISTEFDQYMKKNLERTELQLNNFLQANLLKKFKR